MKKLKTYSSMNDHSQVKIYKFLNDIHKHVLNKRRWLRNLRLDIILYNIVINTTQLQLRLHIAPRAPIK
jgi:hypothetical protein